MKWRKLGLIFDPSQIDTRPDWMHSFAQAPNALIFDDFVRVYFCCRPEPDQKNQFVSFSAFVDLDRKNLKKILRVAKDPILPLGGLGEFDEFGTYPVSFAHDSDEIVAIYGGWSRCESVPFNISLGYARSTDGGIKFTKVGSGPVLSHSLNEPFVITSPKIRKFNDKWVLSYTAGRKWFRDEDNKPEIVYKLRIAFSDDCINWNKYDKDLIEDHLDSDEAQACPDIFYSNGIYHMFFCYRSSLDFRTNPSKSYRIGYAYSNDLVNWKRDDKQINLDVTPGSWDSEMIAYPNVFKLDGHIYMLYAGNGNGRTGFGLAKLEGGDSLL